MIVTHSLSQNFYKLLTFAVTTATATTGLVAGMQTSAEAIAFNFSYTFSDASAFTGTIDGDLQEDGNTLTNISSLVATWSKSSVLTEIDFFSLPRSSVTGIFKLNGAWGTGETFRIASGEVNSVDSVANDFIASFNFSSQAATANVFAYNCTFLSANGLCGGRNGESSVVSSDRPFSTARFSTAQVIVEEPTPVDPVVEEPTPVDPVVEEPTPVDPVVEEPTPVDPVVEEPTPVDPVVEEPTPVDPVVEEPTPVEPVAVNPGDPQSPVITPPTVQPVPEPMTILGSLMAGSLGLAFKRKRDAQRQG